MQKPIKHKYIRIVWHDAVSTDEWTDAKEIDTGLAPIESVGMFVTENDESITIALSYDQNNEKYSQLLNVPKGWLKSRKWIRG